MSLEVGVLGWGAIGSAVGRALLAGEIEGATLAAVGSRHPIPDLSVPVVGPGELGKFCKLVIETAGHDAVREYVPQLLDDGCRVIIVSIGALRDSVLAASLMSAGANRLMLSSGAIGGIDLLKACRHNGSIRNVRLTSTKPSHTLRQDWMDAAMLNWLDQGKEIVVCFDGPAIEAAARFPKNVNVAATLALAAGSWDLIEVKIIADPATTENRHHILIEADAGHYEINISNAALADNPKSSALVVASVLRGIADLAGSTRESWRFV